MSIEADIKTTLDGHSGLSALISSRSYASKLPQSVTDGNISYSRVETTHGTKLNGRNVLTSARFTFEVRDNTYEGVRAIVQQLKNALENASFNAILISEADIPFEDEIENYRQDVDFSIWYQDT